MLTLSYQWSAGFSEVRSMVYGGRPGFMVDGLGFGKLTVRERKKEAEYICE